MPGKIAVTDNAGIFSRLIDKSQIAADPSPNALYGAFPVNAERGLMNYIYPITNGISDRRRYFGAKSWRTLGRSLHDLDKYLESGQPAYAVRVGYVNPSSGLTHGGYNKVSAIDFYPYPKSSGKFPVNLFDKQGNPLIIDVDQSSGVGSWASDDETALVDVQVKTDPWARVTLTAGFSIHDGKSLTIRKRYNGYLLSDIYRFDKNEIEIPGMQKEVPTLTDDGNGQYYIDGKGSDGSNKRYPATGNLDYDPIPYLVANVDSFGDNSWFDTHDPNNAIDTELVVISGTNSEPALKGLVYDGEYSNNYGKSVIPYVADVSLSEDSKDTYAIPNLTLVGVRKKLSNGGCVELTTEEARTIVANTMLSTLSDSLVFVVSTEQNYPIELDLGESISYDVKRRDTWESETLLFEKDDTGYLQPSNGYAFNALQSDTFGEGTNATKDVMAVIYAKGEGEWGNNLKITIGQQAFKSEGIRTDATGLRRICREEVPKDSTYYVKALDGKNTPEKFFSRFENEDGPRIFSITIEYPQADITEFYPDVSFNPHDVNDSGVSIYIENVLLKSNLVAVVVNNHIEDADVYNDRGIRVNREDMWVIPESYTETKSFGGGSCLNVSMDKDIELRQIGNPAIVRSAAFEHALKKILDNWVTNDSYLAFNAGQEILNPNFVSLINDSNGGHPRVLGLTSVSAGQAMEQDKTPSQDGREYDGPTGGVSSKWVAKYNQWILGDDTDAGQQIYTSPVGWIGKLIGLNAIAGMLPYAPAGYRRGILHGASGLSRSWTAKQRLEVVEYGWNPIKYDPTAGYVVWDELTSQPIKSALSNIHVILSYQAMRRGFEATLKGFEFEFNDESTLRVILNMLRGLAETYVSQKFAEEIIVDAAENIYGEDQIRIRIHVRFKGVARTIVLDIIAYPSSQDLSVSMAMN